MFRIGAHEMSSRAGWRWGNVPIPEPHLLTIGASLALQRAHAWPKPQPMGSRKEGAILAGVGIFVAGWATRSAGEVELGQSRDLVTGGAYAFSRHPMYVGWTLIYVGYGLYAESMWPLVLLPGLAGWIHRAVLGEEHRMEGRLGSRYRNYAGRVPRYLGKPRLDNV